VGVPVKMTRTRTRTWRTRVVNHLGLDSSDHYSTKKTLSNYEIKQNIMTNRKALVFQFARRNGIDCKLYNES